MATRPIARLIVHVIRHPIFKRIASNVKNEINWQKYIKYQKTPEYEAAVARDNRLFEIWAIGEREFAAHVRAEYLAGADQYVADMIEGMKERLR